MEVQPAITTDRLLISPLTADDNEFIFELVNTEGWLRFIGNRNIASPAEAVAYIQKIVDNPNITYWVVRLKETLDRIGIVTYIKRDFLEHRDIGFAFLPVFCNKGYAFEATSTVLNRVMRENGLTHILATTVPDNISSIKLLKRLGFVFERKMGVEKQTVHLYSASAKGISE